RCGHARCAAHDSVGRLRCARPLVHPGGAYGSRHHRTVFRDEGRIGSSGGPMSAFAARPSGPFREGDRVQLTGPKNRLHTVTLDADGELHTHHGVLRHRDVIGLPDGSVVTNSSGHDYLALRPLLRDFAMSMPRGAAIVYPKDAAQIV